MSTEERRAAIREALRRRRERLKEKGFCVDCGKRKASKGKTLCRVCRKTRCENERERVARLKQAA
jgi:hypothetical protein